jgi:hypothetical protein
VTRTFDRPNHNETDEVSSWLPRLNAISLPSSSWLKPRSAQAWAQRSWSIARQRAIKEAKAKLQAQGLRVSQFSQRDLVTRADAYLAAHREELIAESKEIVERWRVEGFFGKRARLLSDAQRGKT